MNPCGQGPLEDHHSVFTSCCPSSPQSLMQSWKPWIIKTQNIVYSMSYNLRSRSKKTHHKSLESNLRHSLLCHFDHHQQLKKYKTYDMTAFERRVRSSLKTRIHWFKDWFMAWKIGTCLTGIGNVQCAAISSTSPLDRPRFISVITLLISDACVSSGVFKTTLNALFT